MPQGPGHFKSRHSSHQRAQSTPQPQRHQKQTRGQLSAAPTQAYVPPHQRERGSQFGAATAPRAVVCAVSAADHSQQQQQQQQSDRGNDVRGSSIPAPKEHREPPWQSSERQGQSQRQEQPQQLAPSAVEARPVMSKAGQLFMSCQTATLVASAEGDEYFSAEESLPEGISRTSSLANEITLAMEAADLAPLKLGRTSAGSAASLSHPSRSPQGRASVDDQVQAPCPADSQGMASPSQSSHREALAGHHSPTSPPRFPDVIDAVPAAESTLPVLIAQTAPISFVDPSRVPGRAHTLPAAADHVGCSTPRPKPLQLPGSYPERSLGPSPQRRVGDPSVPSPQSTPQEAASTPASAESTPPQPIGPTVTPDTYTDWDFVSPRLSSRPSR